MNFYQTIFLLAFSATRAFSLSIPNIELIDELIANITEFDTEEGTNSSLKIVGGQVAPAHVAPWIISLQIYATSQGRYSHMCGGSVLSSQWVMTAGHCVYGFEDQTFAVVAGAHNLETVETTQQLRAVERRVIYPSYKGGVAPYDIALLKLAQPLTWTSSVGPVQLPGDSGTAPRGYATLYGWGSMSTSNTPKLPSALHMMRVPIISSNICKFVLDATQFQLISDRLTVCTGPVSGSPSACVGDSGSALSQGNTVIGVVSWGRTPCGSPNSASVYTNVATYQRWIRSVIQN